LRYWASSCSCSKNSDLKPFLKPREVKEHCGTKPAGERLS
jgi:hypothetical protein